MLKHIYLLFLMILVAFSGYAQEREGSQPHRPDAFFKKGFVTSEERKEGAETEKKAEVNPKPSTGLKSDSDTGAIIGNLFDKNKPPKEDTNKEGLKAPMRVRSYKIKSLDLLVLADDSKKLEEVLEIALKAVKPTSVKAGMIYTIGPVNEKFFKSHGRLMQGLIKAGFKIAPRPKLPEKYSDITFSPAWILKSEEGEILFEGEDLLKYYSPKDGVFLASKAM